MPDAEPCPSASRAPSADDTQWGSRLSTGACARREALLAWCVNMCGAREPCERAHVERGTHAALYVHARRVRPSARWEMMKVALGWGAGLRTRLMPHDATRLRFKPADDRYEVEDDPCHQHRSVTRPQLCGHTGSGTCAAVGARDTVVDLELDARCKSPSHCPYNPARVRLDTPAMPLCRCTELLPLYRTSHLRTESPSPTPSASLLSSSLTSVGVFSEPRYNRLTLINDPDKGYRIRNVLFLRGSLVRRKIE